jgi:hypothetical protein
LVVRIRFFVLASVIVAADLGAQASPVQQSKRAGRRALIDRAGEISLARSAAPAAVSDSATIWVLADTAYVVAVRGSNGNACYVSRSWLDSVEPHCFDAEGAATVMRMHMRQTELMHRGMPRESADQIVASALAKGEFRLPQRPAMSYMMSSGQILYGDTGAYAGKWQPHVMIYYPFLRSADIGMKVPDIRAAVVAEEGQADASILIVTKEFIAPRK